MKTVNIHQAKTHFSSLRAKLEKDSQSIVICRNGVALKLLRQMNGLKNMV